MRGSRERKRENEKRDGKGDMIKVKVTQTGSHGAQIEFMGGRA